MANLFRRLLRKLKRSARLASGVILAWGGGNEACHSQATIDYMKSLGFSEFHYVSSNLDPRKDICDRLIANGIFPVYDVEGALWAGSYSSADISWAIPQLKAIIAAGWKGFSSEGMFGPNVEIIRKIGPYCNYGGENGEQMLGGYYGHWAGQHTANYMEAYHKSALGHCEIVAGPLNTTEPIPEDGYELPLKTYKSTLIGNNTDTPKEMGLTWMMYPATADLEMDTAAMKAFLDWGEQQGVKWKAFLFWMGIVQCPSDKLRDGTFMPLLNMVKGKFNIIKRIAWNQESGGISTTMKMNVSTTSPLVNEPVKFTANLSSGTTPLSGKKITIYHMLGGVRYDDSSPVTDANGNATLTQTFGSVGPRLYYASFAGDTAYAPSVSSVLTINVIENATPGLVISGPAACSQDPESQDFFVIGADKTCWWRHWSSAKGWEAWKSLGGVCTSDPAAFSRKLGHLSVTVRGTDNNLWERHTTDGGITWASWIKI